MVLRDRTAVNLGWTAVAQGFSVGLNQIVLLILASILDPYDFGVYAACTVVNSLLVQLTTLGLDYAVIHSKDEWRRVLSNGSLLRILLTIVGFAIVVVLARNIGGLFKIDGLETPIILASSSAVIISLAFPAQMSLTKNLQFKQLSISKISGSVTWSFLALALALLGWSFWSLIVALVASQVAILVSTYLLSPQRFTVDFDRTTSDRLIRFGGITASGLFLAFLATNLDKFVVGSVVGPDSLGVYWAMFIYGTMAPSWLTGVINTVMFPTYTLLRDKTESLKTAYSDTLRYVTEFSAPISMGIAGGSAIFVMALLGSRWESGIASLAVLSLAGFFMSITSPAGNVFISIGRSDLIFKITLAFLVPMILLMVGAAYAYGMLGVAVVVLGHEGSKCIYVVYKAGRLIGSESGSIIREIYPSVAGGSITGLTVLGIYVFLGASLPTLALAVASGLTIYFVVAQLLSKGALLRDIREGSRIVRKRRLSD
jgi:O-antigen/teichoic acid export membrane protein